MQTKIQKLPKSQIEIEIELNQKEMQSHLLMAGKEISTERKINGFRPGNVPFEILKKQVGEMTIYERAAENAVQKSYAETVKKENLEVIGQPEIEILKLAPNNPFIFKARVSILPEIKLADYRKIKIKRKEIKVTEQEVDQILRDLQKMQTKEKLVKRPANKNDKLIVDMDISVDNVPIEGGQARKHSIYLNEPYYIPNLCDQLIGLSEGETKEFLLPFPKEHYQKKLAGKNANFKVSVISVFELEHPVLNDEFAKSLGQKNLLDLKNLIQKNLQEEKRQKEEQQFEIEILEKIVENSRFADLPEILINSETHKMFHELEDEIAKRGLEFGDYLQKIGKNQDQILLDFVPQAIVRIKTALVVAEIAKKEYIEVSEKEIEEEMKKILEIYKDQPELHERIKSEKSRQYLKNMLRNRKVIEFLKSLQ